MCVCVWVWLGFNSTLRSTMTLASSLFISLEGLESRRGCKPRLAVPNLIESFLPGSFLFLVHKANPSLTLHRMQTLFIGTSGLLLLLLLLLLVSPLPAYSFSLAFFNL